jgi:hypothetical protein
VRPARAAAIRGIQLPTERNTAPGADAGDVADAVVAARPRLTTVPARIRRIDRARQEKGIDWSALQLAALDWGLPSPQPTRGD